MSLPWPFLNHFIFPESFFLPFKQCFSYFNTPKDGILCGKICRAWKLTHSTNEVNCKHVKGLVTRDKVAATDHLKRRGQPHLSAFPCSFHTKKQAKLTISSCSCLCSVELSFSCCLPYICMISTTILSLSSSSTATAELVSRAGTSGTGNNNGAGGGRGGGVVAAVLGGRGGEGDGGAWAGLWLVFLPLWLLVSMETAWAWHSRLVVAAAAARWGLGSSGPAETGGDA